MPKMNADLAAALAEALGLNKPVAVAATAAPASTSGRVNRVNRKARAASGATTTTTTTPSAASAPKSPRVWTYSHDALSQYGDPCEVYNNSRQPHSPRFVAKDLCDAIRSRK